MSSNDLYRRLAQLDAKVDNLYRHLGVPLPQPSVTASPQVQQLVREGNVIEAIKVHRAETGLDLAQAKEAVEALQAGIP